MTDLKRQLTLFDATMINVGTMIASAIFIVPATIAAGLQTSVLTIGVWIVGGLVSLLGALCVAELGAAYPKAGGQFVYLREAYGPLWGFLYGWAAALVVNPASIAAIAVGFATYVGFFVPLSGFAVQVVAAASILVLTGLNVIGVPPGVLTQNVLTSLKIGALLAIIALGLALPGGEVANLTASAPDRSFAALAGPFGVAMVAVLWAYDGWIEITYVGGEVVAPEKNLPRSIVLSTALVIALYTLANVAYVYVLGPGKMAASPLVASTAAEAVIGPAGAALVAGAILVSTLGANNGIVLTSARIPYAMARAGLFFSWTARVNPRFRTPALALIAQGILSAALALTGTYEQLITYVVFTSWIFYAMSCGAVLRLRHAAPNVPRPYRAWGYPVTPLLFIAFSLWLVGATILESPSESAIGAGIVIAGIPAYWFWKRQAARGDEFPPSD
ncbi:MAG TPA: amino acid permease [Gemmatimonadales bacterium]|nr:amino acid permease [Gemmatimonadales bacterium]